MGYAWKRRFVRKVEGRLKEAGTMVVNNFTTGQNCCCVVQDKPWYGEAK